MVVAGQASLARLQSFVDNMNKSSSVNAKRACIEAIRDDDDIKKFLYYTYNPYLKYGVTSKNILKNASMTHDFGDRGWNPGRNIFDLLDSLASREITGTTAMRTIYAYLHYTGHKHDELILNIIDKDLKTRAGVTLINSIIPGLIPVFSVALAEPLEKANPKKINIYDGTWVWSRKLDGVRCICITDDTGEATFYTREGNKIETLSKLKTVIDGYKLINRVFDGELCLVNSAGEEDFQGIVSAFRKKDQQIDNPAYCIFDFLTKEEFDSGTSDPITRDYWTRYRELNNFFYSTNTSSMLRQVQQTTLYNSQGLEAQKAQAAELGWEGLMLRKITAYKSDRSFDLLKVKAFQDGEFEVIDLELGEFRAVVDGREQVLSPVMTNLVVGLVVDGKVYRVGVGTGFTIEDRQLYAAKPELIVGKRVTVKYFGVSRNTAGDFSLRFPTFKAIRDFE